MKPVIYERIMTCEEANRFDDSDLFERTECRKITGRTWSITMPFEYGRVVSIEGTDGHIYTGFLERTAEERNKFVQASQSNRIKLGFRFGDNQPTKPLDEKLAEYGFVPKSE